MYHHQSEWFANLLRKGGLRYDDLTYRQVHWIVDAYFFSMELDSTIDLYEDGPLIPAQLIEIPRIEHPIFGAVRVNRMKDVEKYLNEGFDINTKHEESLTDNIYTIKWFAQAIRLRQYSLLHMAAIHSSMEVILSDIPC
ncbi:hypothetical protein ElyMa_006309600 [Elysia marginata]|uniref:Uncharacterized protein n=1 Tax=Elysia marginata TaxID=1093978 RepID=A0AAV4HJE4_9GAST|nr:hypothetical protein ElyMa_006309600 [Elysia marginata]